MELLSTELIVIESPTIDETYQHINSILDYAISRLSVYALRNPIAQRLFINLWMCKKRLRMVYEGMKGGAG